MPKRSKDLSEVDKLKNKQVLVVYNSKIKKKWKEMNNYGRRSLVETAMYRFKILNQIVVRYLPCSDHCSELLMIL